MIALYIIGGLFLLNCIVNDIDDETMGRSVVSGLIFLILAELWRYFLP